MAKRGEGRKRDRPGYVQLNATVEKDLKNRVDRYFHLNHPNFESVSEAISDLLEAGLTARGAS